MTEETLVPNPAETQNTAETATETPLATDATEDAGQQPTSTEPPPKDAKDIEIERYRRAMTKRDRTQGKLHAENEQLRRQVAEYAARQPVQSQEEGVTVKPSDFKAAVEREAATRAEQLASHREFLAKCNSVAAAGRKEFAQDFHTSLDTLIAEAGDLITDAGATPLGEAILDSDKPAALINYLGKHPEIAAELDGLTTARLARKLVAIEREMTEQAKPKTSTAPKPLEPVRGSGASKLEYSPDMSDTAYAKWSNAQKKS